MARNKDMIANYGTPWNRPRSNGADMVDRAIGTNLRGSVDSYLTQMGYQHTRSNLGIRMKIDVRHKGKTLLGHGKHTHNGQPTPPRPKLPDLPL